MKTIVVAAFVLLLIYYGPPPDRPSPFDAAWMLGALALLAAGWRPTWRRRFAYRRWWGGSEPGCCWAPAAYNSSI